MTCKYKGGCKKGGHYDVKLKWWMDRECTMM